MENAKKTETKKLVRICNTDIEGNKSIYNALRKVHGISYNFSNAVCRVLDIDKSTKIEQLDTDTIKKIEQVIANPLSYGIPCWLVNRQRDKETNECTHLIGSNLKFKKEMDIKILKKIKCYKGIRHSAGLPVRGQRTRAHFRTGRTVGVLKKVQRGKV